MKAVTKNRVKVGEDYKVFLSISVKIEGYIQNGTADKAQYYWQVSNWARVAIGTWAEGLDEDCKTAGRKCVAAVLQYFYGPWRECLIAEKGLKGHEVWQHYCLWFEEVQCSLPFASALSDWEAVKQIAAYPPEDKQLPQAAEAKGETAWGWALITYLRRNPGRR